MASSDSWKPFDISCIQTMDQTCKVVSILYCVSEESIVTSFSIAMHGDGSTRHSGCYCIYMSRCGSFQVAREHLVVHLKSSGNNYEDIQCIFGDPLMDEMCPAWFARNSGNLAGSKVCLAERTLLG